MSRSRRGIMSESFKNELAKDLGFYEVVQREGWEGIRTKDAGNMVKRAIQIAQEQLVKQYSASTPSMGQSPTSYSSPQPYHQPLNQASYNPSIGYNQPSTYSQAQVPQSYSPSQNFVSGGKQQTQSTTYKPAYTPVTKNNVGINSNVSSNTSFNPNQAHTAQLIAGTQQAAQVEQRPY